MNASKLRSGAASAMSFDLFTIDSRSTHYLQLAQGANEEYCLYCALWRRFAVLAREPDAVDNDEGPSIAGFI